MALPPAGWWESLSPDERERALDELRRPVRTDDPSRFPIVVLQKRDMPVPRMIDPCQPDAP